MMLLLAVMVLISWSLATGLPYGHEEVFTTIEGIVETFSISLLSRAPKNETGIANGSVADNALISERAGYNYNIRQVPAQCRKNPDNYCTKNGQCGPQCHCVMPAKVDDSHCAVGGHSPG
uniref:Putative salivary secreted protein n=1 Tax=Ornithodoros parkeri TaxID=140564 RepID=A6N9R5_ORNPR|nr:putative salivary secreted protein [Ornithodoros parkeri]